MMTIPFCVATFAALRTMATLGVMDIGTTIRVIGITAIWCMMTYDACADQPEQARVTQIINDVKLLPNQAMPRPAAVNDQVRQGTAVRTGVNSRTELTFSDLSITRLGASTVFSFRAGTRDLNLDSGAVLIQVPPGGLEARVTTAAVTAAISGGTAIVEATRGKFLVLEGVGRIWPVGHPELAVTVHAGEMVWILPNGQIGQPEMFNVQLVYETSLLITDFPTLPNEPLIQQVIRIQQEETGNNPPPLPNNRTAEDIISQRQAASPTPSISPTASPGKFGAPQTIASPNPYVIDSGTTISTDPLITTNGRTNFGTIYRDPSQDGPFATWPFGSGSSFDRFSGFGGDSGFQNIAVFKFRGLQLAGVPTVSTANGGVTRLGLIGIDGITSAAPGGTFGFGGLDFVSLVTQNGPITLGSEITFQSMNRLLLYARGASGNMTLASAFDGIATLNLNAQGTLQVNGNATNLGNFNVVVGSNFLTGTGHITSGNISISSLGNINFNAAQFTSTGSQMLLQAGNTLTITADGDQTVFTNPTTFAAAGTAINVTASATPPLIHFNPQQTTTFMAGAGGIQAPFIVFDAANLSMTSAADINVYGISIPPVGGATTLQGAVKADGSFTAGSDVTIGDLTATAGRIVVGGNLFVSRATAGTTIGVTGSLSGFDTATAGGDITASSVAIPNIHTPNGVLRVGSGGIHPFVESAAGNPPEGAMVQHTFTVSSIVSPNGIDFSGNQFNGTDGFTSGGRLTINAVTLAFDPTTGVGPVNFNGADENAFSSGGPSGGGDGGMFIVNATGDIITTSDAPITATTGFNSPSNPRFSGAGGHVQLITTAGSISVDSLIQVSSDDPFSDFGQQRSASGGDITLFSGLSSGQGITLTANAHLLSLLNATAPGPGGTISITTNGADITTDGEIRADRGTIFISNAPARIAAVSGNRSLFLSPVVNLGGSLTADTIDVSSGGDVNVTAKVIAAPNISVRAGGNQKWSTPGDAININQGFYGATGTFLATIATTNGIITLNNANVHADAVKVGAFGDNGVLRIGGGSLNANSLLKLYAPGSNGVIDFVANVTLSSQSAAAVIAANTVTIENSVVVTINGNGGAALVYTNNPNYHGSGGNDTTTGEFQGNGASTQPLSQAPPFTPTAVADSALTAASPTPAPGEITGAMQIKPARRGRADKLGGPAQAINRESVRSSVGHIGFRVGSTDQLLNLIDDADAQELMRHSPRSLAAHQVKQGERPAEVSPKQAASPVVREHSPRREDRPQASRRLPRP